ncbi:MULTISPECIES: DUF4382 domain-containing protein [Colwellia]|uniref:DUF4382 domain-containing protein n=1 Tax=Colwellia marinimaniae TaxID=1513592 RepID=A0ABQ0MTH0_9GAMM|nr:MULTISPECIES: DUF4382 domain-containing protein [Colwellia]GAW95671.1 hypothetical protein MTCD1_01274 [Colwellia marinimaniae]
MLNKHAIAILACLSLFLTACNSDNKEQAKFSLGLSDAPVDDAEIVMIKIDSIKVINTDESNGKQEILIEEFTYKGASVDSIQVNLLDFTGTRQIKIIDEAQGISLKNGVYTMELNVDDAGSYVVLKSNGEKYDIKIPSSRLRLGEFTVHSDAVQVDDKPAYTIEFDLTQSLVLRGNDPAKNGYIIKPHGVRIVSLYGDISGTVSAVNTNLGACMVYLYDGTLTESVNLADLFDSSDEFFDSDDELFEDKVSSALAPLAATNVDVSGTVDVKGTYSIGFVPEGAYTVALRCDALSDNNIQYERLTIPSTEGNLQTVNVSAGISSIVDF